MADAALVLYDPLAMTQLDAKAREERYVTIGADPHGRLLVVVFTWRGSKARLISGREATPSERRWYEEGR